MIYITSYAILTLKVNNDFSITASDLRYTDLKSQ